MDIRSFNIWFGYWEIMENGFRLNVDFFVKILDIWFELIFYIFWLIIKVISVYYWKFRKNKCRGLREII